MNLIDLIIVVLVFFTALRGLRLGALRQAFSLVGFWGGFFIGSALALHIPIGSNSMAKLLWSLGLILGCAFILSAITEFIGGKLAQLVARIHLRWLDSLLGGILGGLTSLVTVWLLATLLANPLFGLTTDLQNSRIVSTLNTQLPPPPAVISQIERGVFPSFFPKVFSGLSPAPAAPVEVAVPAEVQRAVDADKASVVKVEGISCNVVSDGSGFVVEGNLVATNAHVIAGVHNPVVYDSNGTHEATTVFFDPRVDFALLRVDGLAGKALSLVTSDEPRGTKAAVLGYPGGGSFTAVSAGILQKLQAVGRDIYNQDISERDVYEIQADVEPGNSGGPLVLPDGRVIGVVFARSEDRATVGYALTAAQIANTIRATQQSNKEVSTQGCTAD